MHFIQVRYLVSLTKILLLSFLRKLNPLKLLIFGLLVYVMCLDHFQSNRLQLIMPAIISEFQSIFIPIVYEFIHFLQHKMSGKKSYMSIKSDMNKPYNRVE